jgi:hypothetical protein
VKLSELGYDSTSERRLFLLELASLSELPAPFALPSKHFTCLLALDATSASPGELARLASGLLGAGAVYVCAWGPDCERVQQLFDDAILVHEPSQANEFHVMTTSHADRPIEEALCFLLRSAYPSDAYWDSCRAELVVVVGLPEAIAIVSQALTEPEAFVQEMCAADDAGC